MRHKLSNLLIAIIIPLAAGLIGSFFTSASVNTWYPELIKPSFNPPNWLFSPVWSTLYILMGIAFYLIWQTAVGKKKCAYRIFFVQLALNIFWSVIFFGLKSPQWAFYEILALWLFIFGTIYFFYRVNKLAAALLIPYILWVTFAAVLNFAIWQLNL